MDCDDEYWGDPDPAKAFRQPADKPSHTAAFIHMCRIKKIHLRAMRSLVSCLPTVVASSILTERPTSSLLDPQVPPLPKPRLLTLILP